MKVILFIFVCLVLVTQIKANTCLDYVNQKLKTGKYCELQNDEECWNDMKSYDDCKQNCYQKSQKEPFSTVKCVKQTCNPSIPSVQLFKREELVCVDFLDIPDFQGFSKCEQDIFDNTTYSQTCQQRNTDCIQSVKSAKQCSIACMLKTDVMSEQKSCLETLCSSLNPQAQGFINSLIKCNTVDNISISSNILTFTSFLFVFLII
ncbi:hypothetical protein ABPG74_012565 [Tetrahymena malaccensis]